MAAGYDMTVRVIPLEEHHSFYSTDDIEMWEVTRKHVKVKHNRGIEHSGRNRDIDRDTSVAALSRCASDSNSNSNSNSTAPHVASVIDESSMRSSDKGTYDRGTYDRGQGTGVQPIHHPEHTPLPPKTLEVCNWGKVPKVHIRLNGKDAALKQDHGGLIGG